MGWLDEWLRKPWFDRLTTRQRLTRLLAKHRPSTVPDVDGKIEAERTGAHRTYEGTGRDREPVEVVTYNPTKQRIYVVPKREQRIA